MTRPELVFAHGWGFHHHVWDALAAQLADFPQRFVDFGFFGEANSGWRIAESAVLIGHSYGFIKGMMERNNWAGWVAVNAFPHFVQDEAGRGGVPRVALRALKKKLLSDPAEVLASFHERLGSAVPDGVPNVSRLSAALDDLAVMQLDKPQLRGLVLAGGRDPLVLQAVSESMGAWGELHLLEEAGHLLPSTHPDWCATRIREFLA